MTAIAEIFVGLLLAVAVLGLLARKLHIPYPILFVVGGSMLGLIPKLPKVRLDPELVHDRAAGVAERLQRLRPR
jgi:NhaP-type Na+/H+ or K+/H+ antiporter